ncbi:agamous-like MADS-box protein AGL80 [Cicer arietinum]|uniref:Agamous-like MADS-box protein AGL80 n=1 Tax=Cicer arietinum TaxID=3827 RepID=A0A1S2Y752_CICAR|nr:agamous-like MADS-box protein AGL80 [Cicer arietinum]
MVRKKVKLAYIVNHGSRRATFRKRKNGIFKKISELTTLCGIEACAIIYGENEQEAEVWPSPAGTRSVLNRFMSLPELERRRKMVDLERFLTKSIEKAQELLKKQWEENKKKEMSIVIDQFIYTGEYNIGNMVSLKDLNDFSAFIDLNLSEIDQKLNSMEPEIQGEGGNGAEPMIGIEQQANAGADVGPSMSYNMQIDD